MSSMKTPAALAVITPLLIAALSGCTAAAPVPPIHAVAEVATPAAGDSVGSEALSLLATIEVTDEARPLTSQQTAALSAVPPTPASGCAEAKRITAVKAKNRLTMTHAEHDHIAGILNTCA